MKDVSGSFRRGYRGLVNSKCGIECESSSSRRSYLDKGSAPGPEEDAAASGELLGWATRSWVAVC